MIQYAHSILYVPSVEKTISFYEEAFGFQPKLITPEQSYGEPISGETTIAFASTDLANTNLKNGFTRSELTNQPSGIELAFTTEQPSAIMKKAVEAGATVAAETLTDF